MEMCARKYMFGECAGKYMFGDKSTFGSSQNGHNMHKKGQQEKIFFCTLNCPVIVKLIKYSAFRKQRKF